jgi:molybdopterin-containing oxidoreductase family membrane subunit
MQQMQQHTNGHHRPDILTKTPQQVTEEVLGGTFRAGSRFWLAAGVMFALLVLGVVGFIIRTGDGTAERGPWGYFGAMLGFLLTTAMAAPIVSVLVRLTKAHWGKPIVRAAQLWGVVGILCMLMIIPLLFILPSASGRNTIWFYDAIRTGWPPGAPHEWVLVSFIGLLVLSILLVWVDSIPDLATARDHAPAGARKGWYDRLSLGWEGTKKQWRVHRTALVLVGVLYLMNFVYVNFVYSSDFAQSFVPGWKDSIFPATHTVNGFQSALALTILTAFVLRTWGGYKDYIFTDQFWALAKLMLPLSVFWFYFWFSGFITYWYGRSPAEHGVLTLLYFGPYRNIFVTSVVLNFVLPLFLLIQNKIRRSILGPTVVAVSILVGTFLDRIRLYNAAFSVPNADLPHHVLEKIPPVHFPDGADVLIMLGAVGGAVFLFMMATRIIPVMNIWESKEALLLQRIVPVLKVQLKAIGKPE